MACISIIDDRTLASRKKSPIPVERALPRIAVADDQPEILQFVSMILQNECQIVGMASNGEEILDLVYRRTPDVVLLDIFMPILNGIETASRVKSTGSRSKIVFLTVNEDPDFFQAAISVGALGYVLKPHMATDLVPAIKVVLEGHFFVSSAMHFG